MNNLRRAKRISQVLLCISFSLFFRVSVAAQYRFDTWTTDEGLPQNSVTGIVQSDDGYIWGATNGGIIRFDGIRFKVFNKSNAKGLRENRVFRVIKDGFGRLWFLSESLSIIKYEDKEFTTFSEVKDFRGKLQGKFLFTDSQGSLVFSTDKGHFRYENGKLKKFEIASSNASSFICFADSTGGLWLADGTSVRRVFEGQVKTFEFLEYFKLSKKYGQFNPEDQQFPVFYEDKLGAFWIDYGDLGTFRIRQNKIQLLEGFGNGFGFKEDVKGNLWFGQDDGLYRIPTDVVKADKVSFSDAQRFIIDEDNPKITVQSLETDSEGGLWIGTQTNGLTHITPQAIRMQTKEDWGTEDENVNPILEDKKGNMWLGVWNDSLVKYDKTNIFKSYNEFPKTTSITSLFEDSSGRLLIGLVDKVKYFDDGKLPEIKLFDDEKKRFAAYAITEDSAKTIWFATDVGLVKYANEKSEVFTTNEGLPTNSTTTLLITKDKKLWIGTIEGLAFYEDGKLTAFTDQDDLDKDHIRSLYEDSEGVLWIGTYDSGLMRYKDGVFKRITKDNGLFNENVFCTLEDKNGWFWINTNNGIYRVRKQELNDFVDGKINNVSSIGYNKKDGLSSSEGNGGKHPAGIIRSNGELWFPTQKGVAVIDPKEISMNLLPPPVHIEEIFIDKEDIGIYGEKVEIQSDQENLEINYTGLSFINSGLVRFRYRLEGLEESWNEAGTRRTAFYNNLPPGEYRFQVLAANRDGVWDTDGATIKIVKLPHYYETWWFLILSVLAIAGIVGYLFYTRISKFREIAEAKTAYSRRLIVTQEAERKRIAAELHDGLGQSLAIISNRAMMGNNKKDDVEYVSKEFGEISKNALQALEEVQEITSNLHPQYLERLGLTKALKSMFAKVDGVIELDYEIAEIDDCFTKDLEIGVYRIVQESLNNIIKHSAASEAVIRITKTDVEVVISIKDDGRGFDPNNYKSKGSGFGLVGLKERTNMIGGQINIDSIVGKGTKIKLVLPTN